MKKLLIGGEFIFYKKFYMFLRDRDFVLQKIFVKNSFY